MKRNEEFCESREMVRCIDNIFRNYNNCIGFCNIALHKGYVTKKLLKEHECIEKKCTFLDPIEDHIYWKKKNDRQERKNTEKLILEKAKEMFSEYVELVMCKHLYDSLYLLVAIKSNFSITLPKEFLENLQISVYIKTIFRYQEPNIEYTYEQLLPENMRKKLKKYKNDQRKRR